MCDNCEKQEKDGHRQRARGSDRDISKREVVRSSETDNGEGTVLSFTGLGELLSKT